MTKGQAEVYLAIFLGVVVPFVGSYAILSITHWSISVPFWLTLILLFMYPISKVVLFILRELNDRYHFYGKRDVSKEEENKFAA